MATDPQDPDDANVLDAIADFIQHHPLATRQPYRRRSSSEPEAVEAIQFTGDNLYAVAEFCGFTAVPDVEGEPGDRWFSVDNVGCDIRWLFDRVSGVPDGIVHEGDYLTADIPQVRHRTVLWEDGTIFEARFTSQGEGDQP